MTLSDAVARFQHVNCEAEKLVFNVESTFHNKETFHVGLTNIYVYKHTYLQNKIVRKEIIFNNNEESRDQQTNKTITLSVQIVLFIRFWAHENKVRTLRESAAMTSYKTWTFILKEQCLFPSVDLFLQFFGFSGLTKNKVDLSFAESCWSQFNSQTAGKSKSLPLRELKKQ